MSESFSIVYDGPALRDHQMGARDLASALVGFADAIDGVGGLIAPGQKVRFDVRATREGSFDIDLIVDLVERAVDGTLNVFVSKYAVAAGSAIPIVGVTIQAMRFLVARLRHGLPTEVDDVGDDAAMRILFADGSEVTISREVWDASHTDRVIDGLGRAAQPLTSGAIDSLTVKGPEESLVIEPDDKMAFERTFDPTAPEPTTSVVTLEVVGLSFRDAGKWRFDDGIKPFWAGIDDEDFIARIESRAERFGKGDRIRAAVETTQVDVDGRLKASRRIARVLEHIPGDREQQLRFDLSLGRDEVDRH